MEEKQPEEPQFKDPEKSQKLIVNSEESGPGPETKQLESEVETARGLSRPLSEKDGSGKVGDGGNHHNDKQTSEESGQPSPKNKLSKLGESERQRIKTTLDQLESLHTALKKLDSYLARADQTPDHVEPYLLNTWLPEALDIVSRYLDADHKSALNDAVSEPVLRPMQPTFFDFTDSFRQVDELRDWNSRYRQKLDRVCKLIYSWGQAIVDDPEAFIRSQKAFSFRNKNELNLPKRALVFLLGLIATLVIVFSPPIQLFVSTFTNSWVLTIAIMFVSAFFLAFVLSRDRKEFWFSILISTVFSLLSLICVPRSTHGPQTTKLKPAQPIMQKPVGVKLPQTKTGANESQCKHPPKQNVVKAKPGAINSSRKTRQDGAKADFH